MLLHDAVYPPARPPDAALTHLVLTRFNMRMFRDQRGIASAPALQEWFDQRLPVFTKMCLPSVLQQSSRPHRWYIGVDGLHPEMVRPLAELCAPHPWITLVAQQAEETFLDPFRRAMAADGVGDAGHVLTTRLDNDDALALDYVQQANTYAAAVVSSQDPPDDFWLAFPVGAQLADGGYRMYIHTRNHFLTRVVVAGAHVSRDATALAESHSQLFRLGQPVYSPLTSTPMWLQNVHDHNVSNAALRDPLLLSPPARAARHFGLHVDP